MFRPSLATAAAALSRGAASRVPVLRARRYSLAVRSAARPAVTGGAGGQHGRRGPSMAPAADTVYRTFFFGKDDEGDGKEKKKEKEKKEKEEKEEEEEEEQKEEEEEGGPASNLQRRRGLRRPLRDGQESLADSALGKDGKEDPGDAEKDEEKGEKSIVKVGLGDFSPKYPHLMALPVERRPLFPGIATTVTLTDKATIDALTRSSAGGNVSYVGVFLRKDSHHSHHGPYEPAVVTPEVLTDPDQLYPVGSFAQVHRIQRGADPRPDRPADQLPPGLRPDTDTDAEDDVADNVAEGQASVLLLGHRRVTLTSVDRLGPPVDVTVEHWDRIVTDPFQSDMVRALSNEIVSMIREVATLNPLFREHIHYFPTRVDSNDPMKLADFAASMTTGSAGELQGVLAEKDPEARLHKALTLLTKEREVSRLQQEISAQVEAKMTEAQRRYFLTEQLKSIKKELGMEKDDKDALLGKYRQKLAAFTEIPEEARRAIEAELEKLSALEKNSAEFNVTRTYLDWLTELPWDTATPERYDLARAREILDRQHYGLDDVKDVILQFVAVGKLRGSIQGKILCLAGPPGVGKTSIAKGVAEALGRKFYRFSVGGLSDVSEIRGHRRTYVGAMPGKLIQCLKTTGSNNPLILIDEIDKLGKGFQGDPASALLELLDPSQNSSFRDTYLDVPVDMSKVLFMCTANVLETIPGPLLDRMEIINLSGYDVPEKLEIAERYLVPKSMLESGLLEEKKTDAAEGDTDAPSDADADADPDPDADPDAIPPLPEYLTPSAVPADLAIERSSLESLVRWYCREAGVRNLEKHIRKICRKLALQVVAAAESAPLTERTRRKAPGWTVDADTLDEYVGKPPFTSDRMFPGDTPHGVAMGLAWTSMGGAALYIETQGIVRSADAEGKPRGGGGLRVTGSMKDVMKESTSIAHTVGRKFLHEYQMGNSYFDDYDVHMHVPDGATPKDGPSAGITMVTAMLSLAMDRPVRADLAMTGEVSLSGLVLPVGGIKEKTMAARRAGIDCLVFPAQNKRDYDELPDYLKEGLEVHFAEEYKRVFEIAFMEDDFFDHKI